MAVFTDGHVHLDSRTTILAVLDELVGADGAKFRGTVSAWPDQNPSAPAKWSLEINDTKGNQTTAGLGDHLVLTFGRLLRLSHAEYLELTAED